MQAGRQVRGPALQPGARVPTLPVAARHDHHRAAASSTVIRQEAAVVAEAPNTATDHSAHRASLRRPTPQLEFHERPTGNMQSQSQQRTPQSQQQGRQQHHRHERDGTQTASTSSQQAGNQQHLRQRRLNSGLKLIRLQQEASAASAAAALAGVVRSEQRAAIEFWGHEAGFKGLKALTLTNDFFNQADRGISFRPEALSKETSGPTLTGLRADVRTRRILPYEHRLPRELQNSMLSLDLSVGARQSFRQKFDVDFDLAYHLADVIFDTATSGALLPVQVRGAREPVPSPMFISAQAAQGTTVLVAAALANKRLAYEGMVQRQQRHQAQQASGSGGHGGAHQQPQASHQRPHSGQQRGGDSSQEQQQWHASQQQPQLPHLALVECTVYRMSKVAPRPDGKDGFLFAIMDSSDSSCYRVPGKVRQIAADENAAGARSREASAAKKRASSLAAAAATAANSTLVNGASAAADVDGGAPGAVMMQSLNQAMESVASVGGVAVGMMADRAAMLGSHLPAVAATLGSIAPNL